MSNPEVRISVLDPGHEAHADATRLLSGKSWAQEGGRYDRGQFLGRYMILETVGSGGMSVVYRAYDPELERRVAIKVLKSDAPDGPSPTPSSPTSPRARLHREARALARLSHPNVLPVFDVGIVDSEVFLAMEYVDGCTLAAWLKEKERPWRHVVEKFVAAGKGLAAAHSAGLIHRDFKPHNVLLANDGAVRVMDFGLVGNRGETCRASAEHDVVTPRDTASDESQGSLTETGALMGTPAYMAPEQHLGGQVDAAADQYAFCVALYQGLYGQAPFARGPNAEVLKAKQVRGFQPVTSPRSFPRWLRKVVLRGLAPDPAERWPSMEALLVALDHDPRRIARRTSAVAVGLAIALLGGWAFGQKQQQRETLCAGGPVLAESAWNSAIKNGIETAFNTHGGAYAASWPRIERMVDEYMGQWQRMHRASCEATHLRGEQSLEVLDLRMACLDGRLRDVRAFTKLFTNPDSTVVENAAKVVSKLSPIEDCGQLERVQASVRPPPETLKPVVEQLRQRLADVRAMKTAGKYIEAVPMARRLLQDAQTTDYRPLIAQVQLELGVLQSQLGEHAKARESLAEAGWLAEGQGYDEIAARAQVGLVFLVGYTLGDFDEGLKWSRHARASLDRLGGHDEIEADFHGALGTVYAARDGWATTEPHFRRALGFRIRARGEEHLDVATAYDNLANALAAAGCREESMELHRRALEIVEEQADPNHPIAGRILINLGETALELGQFEEGREMLSRSVEIVTVAHGPTHPNVGFAEANLSLAHKGLGDLEGAEDHMRRALAIAEEALGEDHPAVPRLMLDLCHVLISRKKFVEAQSVLERARHVLQRRPDPIRLARLSYAEGALLRGMGRDRDAAKVLQKGIESLTDQAGLDRLAFNLLLELGAAWLGAGRPKDAVRSLERALQLDVPDVVGPTGEAHFVLARSHHEAGLPEVRIRHHVDRALEAFEAAGAPFAAQRRQTQAWAREHLPTP